MNAARLQEAERSLNGAAKKVLDCVPFGDPLSMGRIVGLLAERGQKFDPRVVQGCLAALLDSGLVREAAAGTYQRVAIPAKRVTLKVAAPAEPAEAAQAAAGPAPDAPRDTLAKLADMAAATRAAAADLTQLADRLDDLAIEVEERIQAVKDRTAKLEQLSALLRDLNAGGA